MSRRSVSRHDDALIALRVLGLFAEPPVYAKAAKDFAGLLVDDPEDFRIQPCLSPVWDTAINSLRSPSPDCRRASPR